MADWANAQVKSTKVTTTEATGVALAFDSNVTGGQVIVAAGLATGSVEQFPTFTDTSGNVTSWSTPVDAFLLAGVVATVAISWGLATADAACTPKCTWGTDNVTNLTEELYIGAFDHPAGTPVADGTPTVDSSTGPHGQAANIQWPAGGGSDSNDLLVNITGFAGSFSSFPASPVQWTGMGTQQGDGCGYILNVPGNTSPNVTQDGTKDWVGTTIAIKVSGGGPTPDPATLRTLTSPRLV